MANHVTNIIVIEYPESQKEKILDIYESMKSELFTEIYEPVDENLQNTRSWWEQNIGAKWVRLQDIEEPEEGSFMINLESAWSEVGPLVERIDTITEMSVELFISSLMKCLTSLGVASMRVDLWKRWWTGMGMKLSKMKQ